MAPKQSEPRPEAQTTFDPALLDQTNRRLLAELLRQGRLSHAELGRRVGLSSPAVAERVRRMEHAGVITGYSAHVSAPHAGHPLLAFIQLRCSLGTCLLKTANAEDYPELIEIHKLSGEYCTMVKVRATSLAHFEGGIERLGTHGEMRTHIVLSTQYDGRPVEPPTLEGPVTPAPGWTKQTPPN